MTKRELYVELFPDRKASNKNKHYSRFTLPALIKVKEKRIYDNLTDEQKELLEWEPEQVLLGGGKDF